MAICTDPRNNFNDIFPHAPIKNLRSLSYKCFEEKSHLMGDPFEPFINYLRNFQPEATYSTLPTSQALRKIEISFIWLQTLQKPRGTIAFNELAISIFTFAPLLQELKIVIANRHQERAFWSRNHLQDPREGLIPAPNIVARHIQIMSISVPACVAKHWLAERIASGAFPNLSEFTFRSALSRGHNGCKCKISTLPKNLKPLQESLSEKLGILPTNFAVFQTYLKNQDSTLVVACQKAAINKWTMRILKNTAEVCGIPKLAPSK